MGGANRLSVAGSAGAVRPMELAVYQRFARWSKRGVWQGAFEQLARDADFEEVFIDSTIVRAHQHAAGAAKKTAAKHSGARAAG